MNVARILSALQESDMYGRRVLALLLRADHADQVREEVPLPYEPKQLGSWTIRGVPVLVVGSGPCSFLLCEYGTGPVMYGL